MRLASILTLLLLLSSPGAKPRAGEDPAPTAEDARRRVLAASWFEKRGAAAETVTALYLRPGEPLTVHIGFGGPTDSEPGYGEIHPESFRRVDLRPGSLALVRRPPPKDDRAGPASAVLVSLQVPPRTVDVHELIHEEFPPGAFYFEQPLAKPAIRVDRHVVQIGETLKAVLSAPPASTFREETMEIARVARRLAVDGDDPAGDAGFVTVRWLKGEGGRGSVTELAGTTGEARIRSHFDAPRCPWANRHVGWMRDLWILEYHRAARLSFLLETGSVARAGRVSNLWKGYGAWCLESIYPNGFGGSSSNLALPPILVLPRGTPVREITAH